MQVTGGADSDIIAALQVATRDLLAVALQSLDCVPPGIKLRHMRLLIAVDENPAVSSARLADSLGVSPSSVTRQADQLCAAGYLTRNQPADDRRMVLLALTPAGERIVDAVLTRRAATFERAVTRLTPETRHGLASGLGELHRALRAGNRGE